MFYGKIHTKGGLAARPVLLEKHAYQFVIFTVTEDGCMIRKWSEEHGR
jgi:hypothetical protein